MSLVIKNNYEKKNDLGSYDGSRECFNVVFGFL